MSSSMNLGTEEYLEVNSEVERHLRGRQEQDLSSSDVSILCQS